MHYSSFSQLPQFLRDYVRDVMDEAAERWVETPLPALHGKTFLTLANEKGIRAAAEFALNFGSNLGVPTRLEIPAEYD